ncbi:MAG: DUF763 domain-containing protein, partial [Candidatus Ranarchaeia archaeon]
EDVIVAPGIGAGTLRGLALIAELVYGEAPSWNDPVKYTFTVGGKDGVPYPVNTSRMDKITYNLKQAIENARIGEKARLQAIRRLTKIACRLPIKEKTIY